MNSREYWSSRSKMDRDIAGVTKSGNDKYTGRPVPIPRELTVNRSSDARGKDSATQARVPIVPKRENLSAAARERAYIENRDALAAKFAAEGQVHVDRPDMFSSDFPTPEDARRFADKAAAEGKDVRFKPGSNNVTIIRDAKSAPQRLVDSLPKHSASSIASSGGDVSDVGTKNVRIGGAGDQPRDELGRWTEA